MKVNVSSFLLRCCERSVLISWSRDPLCFHWSAVLSQHKIKKRIVHEIDDQPVNCLVSFSLSELRRQPQFITEHVTLPCGMVERVNDRSGFNVIHVKASSFDQSCVDRGKLCAMLWSFSGKLWMLSLLTQKTQKNCASEACFAVHSF